MAGTGRLKGYLTIRRNTINPEATLSMQYKKNSMEITNLPDIPASNVIPEMARVWNEKFSEKANVPENTGPGICLTVLFI